MQQLKIQDEPRAYLEANVNTVRIQDVEDSWGESIAFVSGQPALTDKVIHDTFGGHDDGKLFHQPAALRGSAIMPHLWESVRKHLLVNGEFFGEETLVGCFNQWWKAKSVDYIDRHTNQFHSGMEGAVKYFMPLLPNRQDISVHGSWCGQGSSGHRLLSMTEGRTLPVPKVSKVDWTDLHENMSSLLLLYFCSIDFYLLVSWSLQTHFSIFPTRSTAIAILRSDYPKLHGQDERYS